MTSLECVIPFTGFYNSLHDAELDSELGSLLDTQDRGDANPALLDAFWRRHAVDWRAAHESYARRYSEELARAIGTNWTFSALDSPREYNFVTDRIFVSVTVEECERWLSETNDASLRNIARQRHTSRDGFISFYDPDPFTWGAVGVWEPEQLHTLLLAWIDSRPNDGCEEFADAVYNGQGYAELELMEAARGNGCLHNWISDALTDYGRRIVDIAGYLRERAQRKYRPNR